MGPLKRNLIGNSAKVTITQEQNVLLEKCEHGIDFDECLDLELHSILLKNVNCSVPWLSNKKNICKVNKKYILNIRDLRQPFKVTHGSNS